MRKVEKTTADLVRKLLDYDPLSGQFTWKAREVRKGLERYDNAQNSKYAGKLAGCMQGNGYFVICIKGKHQLSHRLAWLWMNGTWPSEQLDHINGDRADNRLANLREATNQENQRNRRIASHNTSGFKGVCFHKQVGRWKAEMRINGRGYHLGLFDTAEEAHQAYVRAAERRYGEFARAQ